MVSPWEVEYTDEFGEWFQALDEPEQDDVAAKVDLLEQAGPTGRKDARRRSAPGGRVMGKRWQDLKDRTMSAERQEKARGRAEAMLAEMLLHEIREALGLSQEEVASRLERKQPTIVGLEKRADAQVSTVRRYIEALGGELEIVAKFPDREIRIKQFAKAG